MATRDVLLAELLAVNAELIETGLVMACWRALKTQRPCEFRYIHPDGKQSVYLIHAGDDDKEARQRWAW